MIDYSLSFFGDGFIIDTSLWLSLGDYDSPYSAESVEDIVTDKLQTLEFHTSKGLFFHLHTPS